MKCIKIFRTVSLVLSLVLSAVAVPAVPASALVAEIVITPSEGEIGQSITITGSGFYASETTSRGVIILFSRDNPGATVDYVDDIYEEIKIKELNDDGTFSTTFNVPSALTSGDDEEDVSSGTYYVYVAYYYPTNPPLKHTTVQEIATFIVIAGEIEIDPEEGTVGTEVTITGTGYGDREDITVEYDGAEVDIESGSGRTNSAGNFECTFLVPASANGDHTITVIGDDSDMQAEAEFIVEGEMAISPESGVAGTDITVSGTGFGGKMDVTITFDGEEVALVETDEDGSFTATFAALSRGAGSYYVKAEDEDGNSGRMAFTMAATLSVSPDDGYVGTEVMVIGTGFKVGKQITIVFDNEIAKTVFSDASGAFNTSFAVPARVAGTYRVVVSDGTNVIEADFSIVTSADINPKTSATSPGYVGTDLTVSGVGFTAGGVVTITYDGTKVATATVKADGTFSASFKAPASSSGEHNIIATDTITTRQFTFIMESDAPETPKPLKPEMGIKAEPEAYFDWQDVTDPSNVTYTLQIATKENFSKDSIVLERAGLTESEYTITREERLQSVSKEAPYYWHVKAIDGALNESQWTGTGSFYLGFAWALPQPVIYLLFGVGALILGVLGFWLGRKTAYY